MKLCSFILRHVSRLSFLKNKYPYTDTSLDIQKKIGSKFTYNFVILVAAIILLLGIYFLLAYAFLQASSVVLRVEDCNQKIKIIEYCHKYTSTFVVVS